MQYLYDPKAAQQAAPAKAPAPPASIGGMLPAYSASHDNSSTITAAVPHLPLGPSLGHNGVAYLPQLHTAMGMQQQQPQLLPVLVHLMKPTAAAMPPSPTAPPTGAEEQGEELSDLLELLGVHV